MTEAEQGAWAVPCALAGDGEPTGSTETEAEIMRVLLGAAVGMLVAWLSRSERAREEARRRLSTAPASLRHAATSAAAASAGRVGRVAEAVDAAPVPQPLKGPLSRAAMTARSAAERLGGGAVAGQMATLSVQELPDGSWIGDATWGGRTLSDAAPNPDVVIRRLATSLAAMPEADRPERVRMTRVVRGGLREEHEEDLATVLG